MAGRLFLRVHDLGEMLEVFTVPPDRSRDERAVYDAWRIALKPRAKRMVRRVEKIGDPIRWEMDEDLLPENLHPAAWNLCVREFAGLYTDLAGALLQYGRVRIVWTPKTRFGIHAGTSRPMVTTKTKAKDITDRKKALASARKAKMSAAKKTLDGVVERLDLTRAALADTLDEVRHLAAALQKDEEERLVRRIDRIAEGAADRQKAEDLLVRMVQGRLKAERFHGDRPAEYGSLLRQSWLVPRARLIPLVDGP
jgi:hypothetical protein